MEYSQAKELRKKSLGTLLAEQEGGALSSLKKAVSLKTQAKITGIKETFDPLNIAKKLTGGSNFAPALLGKLTNRKQSDVDYFSGVKRKSKGKGIIEKLSNASGGGGDVLGILQSIESLLHTTREDDKFKAEEEKNFEEERNLEKARRHKALMEAITGKPYSEGATQTASKIDENDFKFNLLGFFGLDEDKIKMLKSVFGLLVGPLGGLMLMAGFFVALRWLVQYAADNMTDYSKITPKQAQEMLQRNDPREIAKYPGGKEALEELVREGPSSAKNLLDQYNEVKDKTDDESKDKKAALLIEIKKRGGLDLIKETVKDGMDLEVPTNNIESLPEKVPPRPDDSGGKNKGRAKAWDNKFEKYYNYDGTRKKEDVSGELVSDASVHSLGSTVPVRAESPPVITETPKPSQALNTAQKENNDLNLPISKPDPSTVAVNQSANISKGGKPRGNIPLVRNAEETIQRMIYNNTRVV
jgi:hypothetical protein